MSIIQPLTAADFANHVLDAETPVLVDFWSPACGPCRRMVPLLEELAAESEGRFKIFKIDVADVPQLAARYQVHALPTLLVFHGGEAIETLVGYKEKPRCSRRSSGPKHARKSPGDCRRESDAL